MKLLYCESCKDLFNLHYYIKTCSCGKASGVYEENGLDAVYTGGVPIGFHNASFKMARIQRPEYGLGERFDAFIIPRICPTMKKMSTIQ